MSSKLRIDIRIPAERTTIHDFEVEHLSDDLYRIAELPSTLFGPEPFEYQDIVKLLPTGGGVYDVIDVAERAGWCRRDFMISMEFAESEALASVLSRVDSAGGRWVRDAGGFLSILLPPESTWDPTREIEGG